MLLEIKNLHTNHISMFDKIYNENSKLVLQVKKAQS